MPLKRYPPKDLQTSNCESDSSTKGSTENVAIASRNKRKREHGDCNDELKAFKSKLLALFNSKFTTLQSVINDIRVQNTEIRKSQDLISEKYDEIILKIEKLESERNKNLIYIQSLEAKLENMERHLRAACLEIKNIPIKQGESKEDLANYVINLALLLKLSVQPSEIRDSIKINKTP
ncbi:unnamed protein product [Parnassius apollo]|uniref:(apollo) hypothetical protein n=1 Tax=Parnassius apollo TaxID=110799 RepID=A0A8S3XQS4_PARAO|nr:unnamed protein product [Parnassius apollo]